MPCCTFHIVVQFVLDNLYPVTLSCCPDTSISPYVLPNALSHSLQELRWPLRLLLLQIFGAVFTLDPAVVSVCLNTVLPNVLGKDIQENKDGKCLFL